MDFDMDFDSDASDVEHDLMEDQWDPLSRSPSLQDLLMVDGEDDLRSRSPSPRDQRMGNGGEDSHSPSPQEESAVVSLTLEQFVSMAQTLREDMPTFSRFLLTGILDNVQYQVDPIKDALQDDHQVEALRDFDSVLGIHEDICVDTMLAIYPVPKFEDTLKKNIHIKYSFTNANGDHRNIPVHTIPNLCLGKWGTNNLIRVLIPGLYNSETKSPCLKKELLSTFYEKGLRPAIQALDPMAATEWPSTYEAELTCARAKDGKFTMQTKTFAAWLVPRLGDAIREALINNNVPWGESIVFLHQIRGVKHSSGHTPSPEAAFESLNEFLEGQHLNYNVFSYGDWWIDVGLEIASEDAQCLVWRTDSHFHVVKDVLQIRTEHAQRITSMGSSKYIRDLTSHLTSVSGCRISPGVRAQGPHEGCYLQMYTTDKALTYRQEGSHFGKFLLGQDIIKGKADEFCRSLYEIYREASDTNYSKARVEVRVPIAQADSVLTDINIATFRNALVSVDPVVWWNLRACRILAFKYVLEQQAAGDAAIRATDSALLLTAAAPWFINGLHSTPDNGPASRDLMSKVLPLVKRTNADAETLLYPASTRVRAVAQNHTLYEEEEEDEDELQGEQTTTHDEQDDNISVTSDLSDADEPVPENPPEARTARPEVLPYVPYGIVFLRPIRIGVDVNIPRFLDPNVPMVAWKTFKYIFGVERDDVNHEFFKAKIVAPYHPTRVANRVRRTARGQPEPGPPIFKLAERGHTLVAPVVDTGSDLEDLADEIQERRGIEDANIDRRMTALWHQFFLDLTAKTPNPKPAKDSSYCVLDRDERLNSCEATYQDMDLSNFFNEVQWRIATDRLWDALFNKLWPLSPVVGQSTQNLPTMTYYISWGTIVEQLRQAGKENTIVAIRRQLRQRFDTLGWLPEGDATRVWYTKKGYTSKKGRRPLFKRFRSKRLPPGEYASPRVLIRKGLTPTFSDL